MMIHTDIPLKKAEESIDQYEWGIVYQMSELLFDRTEKLKRQIMWEECLEARFFNETSELHFFGNPGHLQAVCISDDGTGQNEEIRSCLLADQFIKLGNILKIKEYYDFDTDGQLYITAVRPMKVE